MILDVAKPIRTEQVNIGSEAEPKFANIVDYWDDDTISKVTELLHEYQDLFPMKFLELKGIVGDLGAMHITLKPEVKLVKQHPYQLHSNYKENVQEELEKMVSVGINEPVEEPEWISPMVV